MEENFNEGMLLPTHAANGEIDFNIKVGNCEAGVMSTIVDSIHYAINEVKKNYDASVNINASSTVKFRTYDVQSGS